MLPFAGSPWVLPVLSGLREHFQNARKRVRKGSQDAFQILILPPPLLHLGCQRSGVAHLGLLDQL